MADRSKGEQQTFSFQLTDYDASDLLSFKFVNDKFNFGTKEDRNLYIQEIKVDENEVSFWDAHYQGKAYSTKLRTELIFSGKGQTTFHGEDIFLQNEQQGNAIDIDEVLSLESYLLAQEVDGNAIGVSAGQSTQIAPDFDYVIETIQQVQSEYF